MKRFLACALSVAMLSSAASAQDMTVWLADAADGDGIVDTTVGGNATIQLWMNVTAGTSIVSFDTILRGYDNGFASTNVSFDVTGFVGHTLPDGIMQRLTRGDAETFVNNTGAANIRDYQYVGDDLNFPLNANSGMLGSGTDILYDEIIITGTADNTTAGFDHVMYGLPSAGQAPGVDLLVFSPFPPPGGWGILAGTVGMGTGSSSTFNTLHVNVGPAVPEPASLALLAIGGFAAIRRRR